MFDRYVPGNLFASGVVFLAWIGFATVMFTSRRADPSKTTGGGRRDSRSIFGIAVQGAAFALVCWGRTTFDRTLSVATILSGTAPATIALLSVALFAWSAQVMGANWALVARTRNDHRLVDTGPFALMRNPIYVALFGMMAATALALGHAMLLAAATPIYVVGTLIRVFAEEKILRATFGAAYDAYASRVKRFIPYVV